MDFSRFGKNWDLALRNNAGLLIANVLMAVALSVTSVLAFYNRERIVLVPPRLDDKMTVAWNNAGAEYFKAFGLFVATLLGNITPANSKFVADQLSTFIEPKLYAPIRTQVLAYADDPRFARAASFNYFSPQKVAWEPATSKVFVLGTITMSSFNPQISGPYEYRTVVYEFQFSMNDGRPLIVDFNSYPGTEARTLAWIEKNQRTLEREAKEREKKGGALISPAGADGAAEGGAAAPDGTKPDAVTPDPEKSVPPTAAPGDTSPPAGVPAPPPAASPAPATSPSAPPAAATPPAGAPAAPPAAAPPALPVVPPKEPPAPVLRQPAKGEPPLPMMPAKPAAAPAGGR
jgi:conjugal transfer pilus assembly protein TraE